MIGLTPRQMDALRFIAGFQQAKGYSPCLREIAVGMGCSPKSKGRIWETVRGLQERGAVRVLDGRTRAIEVLVPVAIPRAPDGAPLQVVSIGGLD